MNERQKRYIAYILEQKKSEVLSQIDYLVNRADLSDILTADAVGMCKEHINAIDVAISELCSGK